MAVAVIETLSDSSGSNSFLSLDTNNFTPNPSVGDLLIAHFFVGDTGSTITLPSGWTQIVKTENAGDAMTSQVSYKIADSSDATGQSLSFSKSGANVPLKLSMMRITGQRASSPITTSSGQANDSTVTVTAPTVTPVETDSLVLFLAAADATANTISGWALATSSPTFTELYELNSNNYIMAAAWGIRPEVTATGSGTATLTGTGHNIGQLVIVSSPQSFTSNDTVTTTDAQSYSIGILILEVLSIVEVTATLVSNRVRNIAKNVSSWFNQDKS